MTDLYTDFRDYAIKHIGINSMQMDAWDNLQNTLYNNNIIVPAKQQAQIVTGSQTPYIIEERQLNISQLDVFSRLMMDRIIWIAGPVNDRMSTVVQAQLMYLDTIDTTDITMNIDTPGGSVKSGLSMVDTMNYIHSDIITVNTGMAASMGSILLGAGTVGKRYSLPNSKVMLHQVSAGAQGNIQDMEITLAETKKYNEILFAMLGKYSDKDPKQVLSDTNRDLWLTAEEAKAYGILDDVIYKKPRK